MSDPKPPYRKPELLDSETLETAEVNCVKEDAAACAAMLV